MTGQFKRSISNESLESIFPTYSGDGTHSSTRTNTIKLQPEWILNKRIKNVKIPTVNKDNKHDKDNVNESKLACEEIEPIDCSICLGPVLEATSALCGHIFCLDCITRAKKFCYKCPLCNDPLGKLIRIYAIDEQMEEYFEPKLSPELKTIIKTKRKARVQMLMKKMELDKKCISRKLKNCMEKIQLPIEKYGYAGCLRHCISQTCSASYSTCCEYSPSWINWKSIFLGLLIAKCWGIEFEDLRPFLVWLHNLLGELLKDKPCCFDSLNSAKDTSYNVFYWIQEKWNDIYESFF